MLALLLTSAVLAPPSERLDVSLGNPGQGFGHNVVALGDLDGDGWDEVAVSAPGIGLDDPGAVWVLSGRDGKPRWTRKGARAGDEFGYAIAAIDWNRDGRLDVAVGAPLAWVDGGPRGRVVVLSGVDGAELARFEGTEVKGAFGYALADIGDVDGKGRPTLAIGAPGEAKTAGVVHVLAARTGALVMRLSGPAECRQLGAAIAPFADVNGDGRPEFLVGAPGDALRAPEAGALELRDGQTGRLLRTFWGFERGDRLGERLAMIGDFDGDGIPEIAVASPAAQYEGEANVGRVDVLGGRRGETLLVLFGSDAGDFFGRSLTGGAARLHTDRALIAVGAPYAANPAATGAVHPGAVSIVDLSSGSLVHFFAAAKSGDHFGASLAVVNTPAGRELWIGAPARGETLPEVKRRRPGAVRAVAIPSP